MLEHSAHSDRQNSSAAATGLLGVERVFGLRAREFPLCGVQDLPTAGQQTESGRSQGIHDSSKMQGLSWDEGYGRPQAPLQTVFDSPVVGVNRFRIAGTDYLGGNHSRMCPGGSGH
jgi:hypothetical protein